MNKIWSFVCVVALNSTSLIAQPSQTGTISGFVYDVANGEALIGANVFLENTLSGSSTNLSGYYVIPRIPAGDYTLVAHYIGYKPFKQMLTLHGNAKREVHIYLQAEAIVMEKIVVTGEAIPTIEKLFARPVSKIDLSAKQINQMPQVAEADLLRSMQTLPGILPVYDWSSELYVRGGTPDQNLYLIDGTDVYNPEHGFGLFSTFNTDAIKKIELSKGGFGAQYGGRLSSILNVTNLDGNREEFEGSAAISIISGKTTLQMPIGDFGSISGSFRRTYWDKTIARAIKDIPNYYFYDGHLKAFFDIDGKNKLTISGYGGEDVLHYIFNEDAEDKAGFDYDWGNTTGSIRWTRVFSPQLFANFWVTGSRFESSFDPVETIDYLEENFISDITFKGNLEFHHSKRLRTNFGFEQKNLHAIYKREFHSQKIDVDKRPRHYVAFIQNSWRPNVRWDIETGLRYNFFDTDENFHMLAPRISAKYRLTSSINLKAAGGKYYQFLHKIPLTFIADIWFASNKYQKPSSSYHAIFGFQKDFQNIYQLEVETFYKTYHNTYSYNQNYMTELKVDRFENGDAVYTETRGVFNRGDGHSSGFELLLRKDRGAVSGWIGYSLAFTKYKIDGINQGKEFAPRHDRTSVLNVVSTIDVKNLFRGFRGKSPVKHRSNWKLGLTFIHSTGQPITTPGSAYFVNALPDHDGEIMFDTWRYERYPSEINSFRLPAYARLDVSLTYERHFRGWSIFPYIQVFNVGNRKNVWFVNYKISNFEQKVDPKHMIPILPTIGVNFEF